MFPRCLVIGKISIRRLEIRISAAVLVPISAYTLVYTGATPQTRTISLSIASRYMHPPAAMPVRASSPAQSSTRRLPNTAVHGARVTQSSLRTTAGTFSATKGTSAMANPPRVTLLARPVTEALHTNNIREEKMFRGNKGSIGQPSATNRQREKRKRSQNMKYRH